MLWVNGVTIDTLLFLCIIARKIRKFTLQMSIAHLNVIDIAITAVNTMLYAYVTSDEYSAFVILSQFYTLSQCLFTESHNCNVASQKFIWFFLGEYYWWRKFVACQMTHSIHRWDRWIRYKWNINANEPTATNFALRLAYLTSEIVCIICLSSSSSKWCSSPNDEDAPSRKLW